MGLVKFRSTVMLELINFVLTKMPPLPTGTSGKLKPSLLTVLQMLFVQSANMRHATTPKSFSPQAPRATKSATVNLWIRQEGLVQDSRFLRYAVVTVRREQLVLSRCRQHLHDQTTITSSFKFTLHNIFTSQPSRKKPNVQVCVCHKQR